jgi:hypothetical protein
MKLVSYEGVSVLSQEIVQWVHFSFVLAVEL